MSRGLRRFFVDQVFSQEGSLLQLSPHETFHLHRVLRLKEGDACLIFNRKGWKAEAFVETIPEDEGARVRLKNIFPQRRKSLFIQAAQALPQKKKMDVLVEKAEELEIGKLWVMETKRTIVKMREEASERARRRWERIVIEAAKQSGSPLLTEIEGPVPFERLVKEKASPSEPSFLFHPDPQGLPFSDLVERLKRSETEEAPESVFLFFGPEGGFTEGEVRLAESCGVRKVFLGDPTLRLETAFLGVISAIRFLIPN